MFVLSDAEDLTPVASAGGSARYRPRTETGFARITHVADSSKGDYWEVWSKDGLCSRYGTPIPTNGSGWSDPAVIRGPDGIFVWLISETVDLLGNRILYAYESDETGAPQRYLSEIRYADYGDKTADQFLLSVAVTYAASDPLTGLGRPDPFSDRRPGFELRTTRRATGITISTLAPTPTLARTIALTYTDQLGRAPSNGVSLLARIDITGHDAAQTQQLPPLEFGYSDWQPGSQRFALLTGELPATSLGAPGLDLVDLFGDGRPCILQLNGSARYWRNGGNGGFDPPRDLPAAPAGIALGSAGVQFADMDGDGRPDLVVSSPLLTGYWPLQTRPSDGTDGRPAAFDGAGFVAAGSAPTIPLSDPSVRLIDLDGDGRVDVLRAGEQMFACYNDGHGSFRELGPIEAPAGLAGINFADPRVRLADMTGDGLTDIVLLYSANVSYWPNLGHGRFGPRVLMASGPSFEDGIEYDITEFDPRRLLLGDVVGDGAADIVYVGDGHVSVWVNQSGNAFARPVKIPGTPRVSDASALRLADIDGNGVAGVLWTADSIRPRAPYAFLDLTGGVKPYLLDRVDNHRGAVTTIDYTTSTRYAEADLVDGRPWRTTLPFPVHVVERTTTTEAFSSNSLTTEYSYHHGYWDGVDREFRGFARVDRRDAEEFTGSGDPHRSPPMETRTWFHVGPVGSVADWQPLDLSDEYWAGDPNILGAPAALPADVEPRQRRDACRALRGVVLRSELYTLDGEGSQTRPYTVSEHQYAASWVGDPVGTTSSPPPGRILAFQPQGIGERTTEWERGSDPRTRLKWTDFYDEYGRPHWITEIAVPRGRNPAVQGAPGSEPLLATYTVIYYATRDDDNRYVIERVFWTGRFELVNDGTASAFELHAQVASDTTTPFGRILTSEHTLYDGQPMSLIGDWGLPTTTEKLAISAGQLTACYSPGGAATDPPTAPPYMLIGDSAPTDGLRVEYFRDTALTQLAVVTADPTIDWFYEGVAPDPVLDPRAFSVRWTGTIKPRYSETYTFAADRQFGGQCTGAIRIWIDGTLVLDDWAASGTATPVPISLLADHAYDLKVEYRPTIPSATVTVSWSSPSQPAETLPTARLAPSPWAPVWGADYPTAFKTSVPGNAGYAYRRHDGWHYFTSGYYIITQHHYDVQDDPTKGRGLLAWEEDPLGHRTTVTYDAYSILPASVTDPAGMTRSASYDYGVLKPNLITDANGNQTAIGYTGLGLPAWIAVMGKPGAAEGDTPEHPGTQFAYDLVAYDTSGQPPSVHTTRRIDYQSTLIANLATELGRQPTSAEIQVLFPTAEATAFPDRFIQHREHSDGLGRQLQTRTQADDLVIDDLGLPADARTTPTPIKVYQQAGPPRVVVSGWQKYDNKGRVVKKWEPFFDQDWTYVPPTAEELDHQLQKVETFYDARGLAIRTVFPDGSEQRVVPGRPVDPANPDLYTPTPWERFTYDPNDNAGRTDPDGSQAWQAHWNTPDSQMYDPLGRVIESVARAEANRELVTRTRYDIAGNALEITDPLGRTIATSSYDSLNRAWRTELMDAGTTRVTLDPLGAALEQRDAKGAIELAEHDALHRLTRHWASDRPGATPTVRERNIYGDQAGLPNPAGDNLLGRPYEAYDEAGRIITSSYDFAGNLLQKERQVLAPSILLTRTPKGPGLGWTDTAYTVDWEAPPGKNLDSYADTLLDPFKFQITTRYDALKRPTTMQTSATVNSARSTFTYSYEPGGGLTQIDLDGTTYVERTVWNARGQRELCVLGNGVMTRYAYEARTFRLTRLRSEPCKPTGTTGWQSSGPPLQDHGYPVYDHVGNLWQLLDTTPASGIPPASELLREFTYDPLYRLNTATGRETDIPPDAPPWAENPQSVDITKIRAYTESYGYDDVGNLNMLARKSAGVPGTYTRRLPVAPRSNRLQALVVGAHTPTTYPYSYDAAGNMLTETSSRHFEWDHANRLATFRTQPTPTAEPSIYGQYRYDAAGERVVKLVRHQGGQIEATAYIDGLFERLAIGTGPKASQHDTIHVADLQSRVALLRVGQPVPGDPSPATLYQLGDHLGSSEVVLDKAGGFVRREEFRPYGETSHGGYARKRYRFTGKERDEESGLYYHGARYYAPWLGRWTCLDPALSTGSNSSYAYGRGRPMTIRDPTGTEDETAASSQPQTNAVEPRPSATGDSLSKAAGRLSATSTQAGAMEAAGQHVAAMGQVRLDYRDAAQAGRTAARTLMDKRLASPEDAARVAHGVRRGAESVAREATPDWLRTRMVQRNIKEYEGNPLGPTFNWMVRKQGGDPGEPIAERVALKIIDSAGRPQQGMTTFGRAAVLAGTTVEVGAGLLRLAGQLTEIYGAVNEAQRTYDLEIHNDRGQLNAIAMAMSTAAVTELAAAGDAAIAVTPAVGRVSESWQQDGSGPTQHLVGEAVRGFLGWGARLGL